MKIFLDTANIEHIREGNELGVIDGVTTNPSLIAKEGRRFEEVVKEICTIVDGPISAEAVTEKAGTMFEEAMSLSQIHPNVVIKVPMTAEGLKVVKMCKIAGIKTNVTLVFSANQALLAAKAGATYVSPFVGRLDDITEYGMELVRRIADIYANYNIETQIIVASVRNPLHVLEAAEAGADIATIPYNVLMQMVKHPLTDIGIQKFLSDWEKVPKE
ncbi:MAG: fructose-6-phosphate aldolase [Candidatus Thermoplasmatota archaeon]|nr:fructose-6-phosphate aldolase [Candidatus Thermoplasmatota archaeon]